MRDDFIEALYTCKLYTSWFGNASHILEAFPDVCLVSIAGKTPDVPACKKFTMLAPHYGWWSEWHDKFSSDLESNESRSWYIEKYYSTVLDKLNAHDIACKLIENAEGRRYVFLLCYETPEKFCHRHVVSQWLNDHSITCEEWT